MPLLVRYGACAPASSQRELNATDKKVAAIFAAVRLDRGSSLALFKDQGGDGLSAFESSISRIGELS
jgi:hypothetical protein